MDKGTAKDFIEDLLLQIQALEDSFRALNARMEQLKAQRDRYAERLFQLQYEHRQLQASCKEDS